MLSPKVPLTNVLNEMEILSLVAFSFGATVWFNHDGNKRRVLVSQGAVTVQEFHKFKDLNSNDVISSSLRFGCSNIILSSSSVDI